MIQVAETIFIILFSFGFSHVESVKNVIVRKSKTQIGQEMFEDIKVN